MVGLLPSKFDFRMMNGHLAGAARLQTPAGVSSILLAGHSLEADGVFHSFTPTVSGYRLASASHDVGRIRSIEISVRRQFAQVQGGSF
jgi:hypothetical protein